MMPEHESFSVLRASELPVAQHSTKCLLTRRLHPLALTPALVRLVQVLTTREHSLHSLNILPDPVGKVVLLLSVLRCCLDHSLRVRQPKVVPFESPSDSPRENPREFATELFAQRRVTLFRGDR